MTTMEKLLTRSFPLPLALLLLMFYASLGFASSAPAPAAPAPVEDPRQVINVLQKAIDTRDGALAESRISFEVLGVRLFANTLPKINEGVASGKIKLPQPLPMLLGSLNADNLNSRRTAQIFLSGELKKFVLYGVDSGLFAGNPRPQSELASLDGGLFSSFVEISSARREFTPAVLTFQDSKKSTIFTNLKDGSNGRSYPLELLLEERDGIWHVIGIENADELLELSVK